MESQEPLGVAPAFVRFNRGDRVMLDLSALAEPPDEQAPPKVHEAHDRMMKVHGALGTVVHGDDNRNLVERLVHRLTGRPAATVRVDWDGNIPEPGVKPPRRWQPYLTPVVYRSQLRHSGEQSPHHAPEQPEQHEQE
ncbi:MAG TPA: hypothetical protein VFG98_08855 [Intrasporangium sp.]|nr:hypothetical protein [Intrasporangium sp.]